MSRQLYPKPKPKGGNKKKHHPPQDRPEDRPYHVRYSDPDNPTARPEWRHYNSELSVRVGAWYNVKFLGFNTEAVMYDREEMRELSEG